MSQKKHNIQDIPGVIKAGRIIAKPGTVVQLPLEFIKPFDGQPRKFFDMKVDGNIAELAQSCKDKNDIEIAITVILINNGEFALIFDGERRYRAAIMAELKTISCVIKPSMPKKELYRGSFKANLQRENMSPVEIGSGIRDIMNDWGMSIAEVATDIGKKESYVRYMLGFLKLDKNVQLLVMRGQVEPGLTRILLSYDKKFHVPFLKEILKVVKARGGDSIHPNEAVRIIRKYAEEQDISTLDNPKGKKPRSHAELVASSLLNNSRRLLNSVVEFKAVDPNMIKNIKNPNFLDIQDKLVKIKEDISSILKMFDTFD